MNSSELYDVWAPVGALWSPWAKPVLFTEREPEGGEGIVQWRVAGEEAERQRPLPEALGAALVLDLPGPLALALALESAKRGWRPVPLFNSCTGTSALLDNRPLVVGLAKGAAALQAAELYPDSSPAFVLDSRRMQGDPRPASFDNRWLVFPQDFPSAALLASRGITRVYLVQENAEAPRSDLAHVLLRWQLAGIEILAIALDRDVAPTPITVTKPSRFRALGQRMLAALRLRRNSAGGFGAVVPMASQGGGGWA